MADTTRVGSRGRIRGKGLDRKVAAAVAAEKFEIGNMPKAYIDGREIEFSMGERLNGIQAAARAGIAIPHYCWHPGLSVVGSCRMCLVEVGTRDTESGRIIMLPKLMPACNTPIKDGTVLVTHSEKVARARAMVEEDLLLRHPIDCSICDKAGECSLQDYHFRYGTAERRAEIRPFTSRKRDLGDITLFVDRCVMCSRCVRFTREISGASELLIIRRGAHEEIDVLPEQPLNNPLSGNVVDLCPVGALADKEFLYKQRVWHLRRSPGICTLCATGCSIWIEQNQDRVYRIKPRENPQVNHWWICNAGRYSYPRIHDPKRLRGTVRRTGEALVPVDGKALLRELPDRLRSAGRLALMLSPFLTVEEAYLACAWIRSLDTQAQITVGPIPRDGEDQQFSGGFRISAQKCPNRKGVEEIAAYFQPGGPTWSEWLNAAGRGEFGGIWVAGGYVDPWIDGPTARQVRRAGLLIVQDLFPTPLSDIADYVLAAGAFAETEGSYVNARHRLQVARRAVRPPWGNRPCGPLMWDLLGRTGLYDPRRVLSEVAAEIPYFHAALGEIPDIGIDLRINQLAEVTQRQPVV